MLKLVEFGLLAVSLLIIFGLVATSPRSQQSITAEIAEGNEAKATPLPKL
ncbi:MAG TPA: hypothetical protein VHT24_05165 [Pseudacidobacterium sp.]|jgi:hypothetical protein|nr:hypothetical protein [Pseudacidobacterium sp.]